jgi:serine/threonine protein kinase
VFVVPRLKLRSGAANAAGGAQRITAAHARPIVRRLFIPLPFGTLLLLAHDHDIAGYRIEGVAGRGGWSVVYRAAELASGRTVAVKAIAHEHAGVPELRARFRQERKVASALDHANVIPLLASGDGYIVMRWVEAARLRDLVPVDAARAARIAVQVGDALDALHAAGYVHRDVKPGNVLVAPGGHAYLTDFGLAKPIDEDAGLTDVGRWLGTVDYAAPEQIRGQATDQRSDVYSLGATLFHAVSGHVPYPRDSDQDTMRAHLHDPVPSHPSLLDPVLRRAMAKEPGDRFETTGELGRAVLEAVA